MINGIIDILENNTIARNLVGKDKRNDQYKFYAVLVPQEEQHPYVAIRVNSKEPVDCKDTAPTDFTYQFSVYCYANTYKKSAEIANAIEIALNRYTGTADSVVFEEIRFVTLRDDGVEVGGNILYVRVLTFDAHVNENPTT
jgi:hypothetical protein